MLTRNAGWRAARLRQVLDRPSRARDLALAVAGGVMTDAAFPTRSWWPLAYLGIALLLVALRRVSVPWGWVVAFGWGLGFFLPHLWWAYPAVGEPIGWLALSVAQSAMVGLFGAGAVLTGRIGWIRTRPWARVAAVAVVWVSVESLRGGWPFGGLPWGTLAFSQSRSPLVGLAPVGSTVAVSFAVVVIAGSLVYAVSRFVGRTGATRGLLGLGAAVMVALGPGLIPLPDGPQNGTLHLGAVQGNVPQHGAPALAQARQVTANHAEGTHRLLDQVGPGELDLVLWPESSADIDPRTDAELGALVDAAAVAVQAPILVGTQRYLTDPQAPGDDPQRRVRYNESFIWDPQAGPQPDLVYAKQHPVPFGEYMPYRDFFRMFTDAVDLVGTDMLAGTEPGILQVPLRSGEPALGLGVGICFEVAYDGIVGESVRQGAEVVVIPTNNASFDRTALSAQQLAMSHFRAVEHSRAVVQVSTMGLSAIISPSGEVLQDTGLWTADRMIAEVPRRTTLTPAAVAGPWPVRVVSGLAVVLVLTGAVVSLRSRARPAHRSGHPA